MFFILSKLLSFFLQPIVWIAIIVCFAIFLKRKRLKRRLYKAAIIVFIFFSNTVIYLEFARLWETPGVKIENVDHYNIGIVLGGMTEYNNDLDRLSLRRGADRIWQALQLYKAQKIDKILISGAHGNIIDKGLKEAEQLKNDLVRLGVPSGDIIVEKNSKNTYQNAVETKIMIDNLETKPSLLLITSSMHMKRAKACFTAAGFEGFGVFSTDHFTNPNRGYGFDQYVVPDMFTFAIWKALIKEWVGYIVYYLVGYI